MYCVLQCAFEDIPIHLQLFGLIVQLTLMGSFNDFPTLLKVNVKYSAGPKNVFFYLFRNRFISNVVATRTDSYVFLLSYFTVFSLLTKGL